MYFCSLLRNSLLDDLTNQQQPLVNISATPEDILDLEDFDLPMDENYAEERTHTTSDPPISLNSIPIIQPLLEPTNDIEMGIPENATTPMHTTSPLPLSQPPQKKQKLQEVKIPAALQTFVKNLTSHLKMILPLPNVDELIQMALRRVRFPKQNQPKEDTTRFSLSMHINVHLEKYKRLIIEAVLRSLPYQHRQQMEATARFNNLSLYEQILRDVENEDWMLQLDSSLKTHNNVWAPKQILPPVDSKNYYKSQTFLESILKDTGEKIRPTELSKTYIELTQRMWNYNAWKFRQLKEPNLPTKTQHFAYQAFVLHAQRKDNASRILLKYIVQITMELQKYITDPEAQRLYNSLVISLIKEQDLHTDFEYKLQNLVPIILESPSIQGQPEKQKLKRIATDIHKSFYLFDSKKTNDLPPRVQKGLHPAFSTTTNPTWTETDLSKFKTRYTKIQHKPNHGPSKSLQQIQILRRPKPKQYPPRHSNQTHDRSSTYNNRRNKNRKNHDDKKNRYNSYKDSSDRSREGGYQGKHRKPFNKKFKKRKNYEATNNQPGNGNQTNTK